MQTTTVDPKSIVIHRETRQRQANIHEIDDLKASIAAVGFINPLVVREVDGKPTLVAGERRLHAALALGLTEVPVTFFENLSEAEAEVIELEENIKRKELHWRDHVKSVGRIHAIYKKKNKNWTIGQTCEALSIHQTHLHKILRVFDAIDNARIAHAGSIEQAYNTLQNFAERKAESIVNDIINSGANIFGETINPPPKMQMATTASNAATATNEFQITTAINTVTEAQAQTEIKAAAPPPPPTAPEGPIICANFFEWAANYTGPKFTLIHCDFPYGNYRGDDSKGALANADVEVFYDNHEEIYWNLLNCLTANLDKLMSYSAHLVFWYNMNFYTETVKRLRAAGLMVHDHPLVWHKTPGGGGGLGVVPGTAVTYPRRTYDTALLAVRGNRPLAKPGMNSYAAPTVGNKIHPSQKPEPMLRFFLSMVVDETTSVLDPTCGSAAALRAAEDLGAKRILGLELDPTYAAAANAKTLQARVLRNAGMARNAE